MEAVSLLGQGSEELAGSRRLLHAWGRRDRAWRRQRGGLGVVVRAVVSSRRGG